jgi:preprotein translocase subunit SecD
MHVRTLLVAALSAVLAMSCSQTQSPTAAVTAPSAACPAIEIAEIAAPDSPGARQFHTQDGALIHVSPDSLVTTSDIADARPAMAEGHEVLEIDLDAASAAAFQEFTASHVGTRLAFVVDHRVRRVARILDPISGQGLIIDPVTASEAAELIRCVHRSDR